MKKNPKLEYIEEKFGTDYKETSGDEIRYDCPYCPEVRGKPDGDYKFYVNTKTLQYICFKCETKGKLTLDDELSDYINSDKDIFEQVKEFLNLDKDEQEKEEDGEEFFKIPVESALSRETARDYLLGRGLTEDDIRYYSIRLGNISKRDFFGRVIIPNRIINAVYTDMYVARAYIESEEKRKRYDNPSNSKSSEVVFNLHRIKDNPDKVIICEGVISAISAGRDAVALYGKYASDEQIKQIIDKKPDRVYVALDGDARKESKDLCSRIKKLYKGEVYCVLLPDEKDPNDLGHQKFQEYLQEESFEYQDGFYFELFSFFD